MSARLPILPMTPLETEHALKLWLGPAMYGTLTRNQRRAVLDRLTPMLPTSAALSCRTPKGVVYLETPSGEWRLSPRAKWHA
jgi:hypothetical protein